MKEAVKEANVPKLEFNLEGLILSIYR